MILYIATENYGIKEVLIDDTDYDLIKNYTWHVKLDKGVFYARCFINHNGKFKSKLMHRIIMGVGDKPKPHIDHINHNGIDNRRNNLRFASIAQNTRNKRETIKSTTGYKGVFKYRNRPDKFIVRIGFNSKKYFGGYFNDVKEAAIKYNELAIKYHGEFACLNQIN